MLRPRSLAAALALTSQAAWAQSDELAAERCLRLGSAASAAVTEVHARWLPPRPIALTFAASAAIGPSTGAHGSAMARTEVSRWSPFYTALQARAFVGERAFVVLDALVGLTVSTRRGTFWREHPGGASAPWDAVPPEDPARTEAWLRARAPDCGVSQSSWRLLGGARLLLALDDAALTPPSQFAVALGVGRAAESLANETRTGLDLALLALFDPEHLNAGVLARVSASWSRLYVGLEGALLIGPEGYGFAALDVGLRLSL